MSLKNIMVSEKNLSGKYLQRNRTGPICTHTHKEVIRPGVCIC